MLIVLSVLVVITLALMIGLFLQNPARDVKELKGNLEGWEKNQERIERTLREEMLQNRNEYAGNSAKMREELRQQLGAMSESLLSRLTELSTLNKNQLDTFSNQLTALTRMNEQKLEKTRQVVEHQLRSLQEENSQKLDKMREVVDEKLHSTLEKRLGESFKVVSDRLEKVHQGLGEMQSLAAGVGDLKKVLSNVKTRGILGEVQLENLLEQMLTSDQYAKNVVTKQGSRDPVEFVIKLPYGLLPIDAKFPSEDYERLQDAQELGNVLLVEELGKALENRIKLEAKKIREKYIDPPATTDFGILFLPFEGLYAEILRRPGFCDMLQREFKVTIAGPTTIAAILNSLQMGFRTLAVQKHASQVWTLLGSVKTEFNAFGDILEKTHKKLQEASNTIEIAARKSRNIERKLKDVQDLPLTPEVPRVEQLNAEVVE